jgi:hypothetical protein
MKGLKQASYRFAFIRYCEWATRRRIDDFILNHAQSIGNGGIEIRDGNTVLYDFTPVCAGSFVDLTSLDSPSGQ